MKKMIFAILRRIRNLKPVYYVYVRTVGIPIRAYKEKKKRQLFRKYGRQTLRDFVKCGEDSGINVYCVFGTLLGVVRDGGIIPHDFDLDMAIEKKEKLSIFNEALVKSGFTKIRQFELHDEIVLQSWRKYNVDVDLYSISKDSKGYYFNTIWRLPYRRYETGVYEEYNVLKTRVPEIKDFIKKKIYNFTVQIPSNYEEVLMTLYGKGWKVPDPDFKDDLTGAQRMKVKELYY